MNPQQFIGVVILLALLALAAYAGWQGERVEPDTLDEIHFGPG